VNLDGSAVLSADPEKVWSVITDPAVLARTIPGCGSLEQVGDDEYRMNVSVGVGAIRGTYAGEVRLSDKQHPRSYVMHASGAGAPGNARAQVTINLEPAGDGKTNLTYSADAVIGGPVAGVGQRMISGVAKRMAGQFFSAIDQELSGAGVVPIESAPSAAAASDASLAVGAPPAAAAGRTFAGKAGVPAGTSGDVRTLALGAVGGAALTLIGVLVGYRLGRR
jgi:carbon monoxide dehydrogenase subunit G